MGRKSNTAEKQPESALEPAAKSTSIGRKIARVVGGINTLLAYSEERPQQLAAPAEEYEPRYSHFEPPEGNRFEEVIKRIVTHPSYDQRATGLSPYGEFYGRPIIGEHTPIHGGIYLSVQSCEALVVDEKYGFIEEVYNELMLRYVRRYGTKQRDAIDHDMMQQVLALVRERLPFASEDEIAKITEKEGYTADQKIALDIFLEYKRGCGRHQMLLAAYLLEKLIKKGIIRGKVYLDSHYAPAQRARERMIYSSAHGYLFVFTPSAETSVNLKSFE